MKALAIDTAITCITVSAKNNDALASLTLDIGMRQSEKLLPAIDYVLKQVELEAKDLDYTALTSGPGSFTGLRLGFAALKAIEAAYGTPIYAVNTLDYYAAPFMNFEGVVLSVIDAHKDKFYAKAFLNGEEIIPCDDYEIQDLGCRIQDVVQGNRQDLGLENREELLCRATPQAAQSSSTKVFVAGEAAAFINAVEGRSRREKEAPTPAACDTHLKFVSTSGRVVNLESLFVLAEDKIEKKEPPLKEYDGPEYFRASEAEMRSAQDTGVRNQRLIPVPLPLPT